MIKKTAHVFGLPTTTEKHSGSKYFGTSSATNASQCGLTSEGFIIAQFPAAIAPIKV